VRNGFWLAVIALALVAIVGGYFEGASSAKPAPTLALHPDVRVSVHPARIDASNTGLHRSTDEAVVDAFSNDDVVVERPDLASIDWHPERISFVVGLCGTSLVTEAGFLHLGVPVAVDLDPAALDAVRVARATRDSGDRLFVHVTVAPSRDTLAALRSRLGDFDGISGRDVPNVAQALSGTGLAYFDERGDAPNGAFAQAGVALVQRDTTIDDRIAETYVAYMLERAAERSVREGRVVVLMRPLEETLTAVKNFLQTHNPEVVSVE
jgi:polysaccharide deacetylase 2 family uncharacterized protein YibQ